MKWIGSIKKRLKGLTYTNILYKYLFGEDIFISYAREDGFTYAEFLAGQLNNNFSCYIDQYGNTHGSDLPKDLKKNLRNSRMLVIIGSDSACKSENVHKEIRYFIKAKKNLATIIPIDFGNVSNSVWIKSIGSIARSVESIGALTEGIPDKKIIDRIKNSYTFKKRSDRTLLATISAILILLILGVASISVSSLLINTSSKLNLITDTLKIRQNALDIASVRLEKSEDNLLKVAKELKGDSLNIIKLKKDSSTLSKAYEKISDSLIFAIKISKELGKSNKLSKLALETSNKNLSIRVKELNEATNSLNSIKEDIQIQEKELMATNNLIKIKDSYSNKNYLDVMKYSKQFLNWVDSTKILKKKTNPTLLNNKSMVQSMFFEAINQNFPYLINNQFIEICDYSKSKDGYLIIGRKKNTTKEKLYLLNKHIQIINSFFIPDSISSLCYDQKNNRIFLIKINNLYNNKPISLFEINANSGECLNLSNNYKYVNIDNNLDFLNKNSSFKITNSRYFQSLNKIFIETKWANSNKLICVDIPNKQILFNFNFDGTVSSAIEINFYNSPSIKQQINSIEPLTCPIINKALILYSKEKESKGISGIHYYPDNNDILLSGIRERPQSEAVIGKNGIIINSDYMSSPITRIWSKRDNNSLYQLNIDLPDNNFILRKINSDSLIIISRNSDKNTGIIQYTDSVFLVSTNKIINKNIHIINKKNIKEFGTVVSKMPGNYRFTEEGDLLYQNSNLYNISITDLNDFSVFSSSEYPSFKQYFHPKIIKNESDLLSVSSDNKVFLRRSTTSKTKKIKFNLPDNKSITTDQSNYINGNNINIFLYRRIIQKNNYHAYISSIGVDSTSTLFKNIMINRRKNLYIYNDVEEQKSLFFDENKNKIIELKYNIPTHSIEYGISSNGNYTLPTKRLDSYIENLKDNKVNDWQYIDCVNTKFNSIGNYVLKNKQSINFDSTFIYNINLSNDSLKLLNCFRSDLNGKLFCYFLNDSITQFTKLSPIKAYMNFADITYFKYHVKHNIISDSINFSVELRDTRTPDIIHINSDSTLFFGKSFFAKNDSTGVVNLWYLNGKSHVDTIYLDYDHTIVNYSTSLTRPAIFGYPDFFPWIMLAFPPDYSHLSFWNYTTNEKVDFVNSKYMDPYAGFVAKNKHLYFSSPNLIIEDLVTPMLPKQELMRIYENKIPKIIE